MKTQVVDKDVFRKMLAAQRQDIRKAICSKEEALLLLGIGNTELTEQVIKLEKEGIKIKSPLKNKYIMSGLIKAFEKIHGIPYKDAVVP